MSLVKSCSDYSAVVFDDVIGSYSMTRGEIEAMREVVVGVVLVSIQKELEERFGVSNLRPTFPLPLILIRGNQVCKS